MSSMNVYLSLLSVTKHDNRNEAKQPNNTAFHLPALMESIKEQTTIRNPSVRNSMKAKINNAVSLKSLKQHANAGAGCELGGWYHALLVNREYPCSPHSIETRYDNGWAPKGWEWGMRYSKHKLRNNEPCRVTILARRRPSVLFHAALSILVDVDCKVTVVSIVTADHPRHSRITRCSQT